MIRALLRRVWAGDGFLAVLGRIVLWPLTLLYRVGLEASRRRLAAQPRFDLRIPVISVGNITVGGTGKTPMVAWLAGELRGLRRRPVIVSRGYGGRRRHEPLVVSDGRRVLRTPAQAGDEAVMLAKMLPGVPVVVGRDRVAAARLAVARLRADVVVLDDGFQQRARFPRALTIVMVDGHRPAGNGALLPAGPLREPVGVLAAAGVILARGGFTRAGRRQAGAAAGHAEIIPWRYELRHLRALAGTSELSPGEWLRGQHVLAVSGIGHPDGFAELLERQPGIGRVERFDMPDHHAWTTEDIEEAARRGAGLGCSMLVTTEKDAVKWPATTPSSLPLFVACVGVKFSGRGSPRRSLREYLSGGWRS